MKHASTGWKWLVAALGLAIAVATPAADLPGKGVEKKRATIAVMAYSDFLPDRTGKPAGPVVGLPPALADRIIEHLANSQRFNIVERKALRRVVMEQRFGKKLGQTYLDKTLDKAISAMENVDGGAAVVAPGGSTPSGRVLVGAGAVGTTGALSDYNDILKDFQDLGTAIGADYLVMGNLEQLARKKKETRVPFSDRGRKVKKKIGKALVRLRVIDARNGTVAGATSFRTQVSETVFEGKTERLDKHSFLDQVGRIAAAKVLDITYPARIASTDPLVLTRGANDGVTEGDVFIVEREGKPIKDATGLVIGRLKRPIGKVRVVRAQETLSVAEPVEGKGFADGDLASLDASAAEARAPIPREAEVPLTGRAGTARGTAKRPRVAIGLIKKGSTATTGKAAALHTPVFTDTLISRLTQTKRFQIIDRQETDQLLDEQLAQALREDRDMASAVGTLKGADYLVYGNLASFSVEDRLTKLPGSNRVIKGRMGHVIGNMRIVDARSGDILASRKIEVSQRVSAPAKSRRAVAELADAYAEQVVLMLMNTVFPIKVAAVSANGTVYVNRGNDGGLSTGEVLDAYRPGEPVIDPDTGVQLGVEEVKVGQVRLTEVEDASSKAEALQGTSLDRGYILKRTPENRGRRAEEVARGRAPERTGARLGGGLSTKGARPGAAKFTLAVGLIKALPGAKTSRLTRPTLASMTDDLITKLSNTGRFAVMERKEVDQVIDEKAFTALSAGEGIEDRLRALVGADYLIHGAINSFYVRTKKSKVAYLDEVQTRANGVALGTFRIVDAHTGAIVAADKVSLKKTYKRAKDREQVFNDLLDRFTTRAVGAIVERLFPIKVLGVAADGTVYINRGQDAGLERGAVFDVMRAGQRLVDPDTGLAFGSAETKVAALKVVSVEPSRARAELVSGGEVETGDILRRPKAVPRARPKVRKPSW